MGPHAPNSGRLAARIPGTFALLIASAALVAGQPSPALAAATQATPGTNLLLNANATAENRRLMTGQDPSGDILEGLPAKRERPRR